MNSKQINDSPQTWALVFETGDEVMAGLSAFANEHQLTASQLTAIGAFSELTLGYFNWQKRDYKKIPIQEQVEVLSLIGDIALSEGKPKLHVHVVVGKADGTAHGGHLISARVRPTLEVIVTESPRHLQRRHDTETGLALLHLEA